MLLEDTRNPVHNDLKDRRKAGQRTSLPELSPISLISLMYALSLFVFYQHDFIGGDTFIVVASLVLGLISVFYRVLKSGAAAQFDDPSLMPLQLGAALALMLAVALVERATQIAMIPFVLLAFSFGVCRLSTASLTILAGGTLAAHLGIVMLHGKENGYGPEFNIDLIQWFVLALSLPGMIFVGKQIQQLRRTLRATRHQLRHYEEKAMRDDLTGLYNRRQLQIELEQARLQSLARQRSFCVCLIDVDHFKQINDTHGHLAGDIILRDFARLARESVRDTDVFGRYGGDEFLQVLPDTDLKGAVVHAERLRVHARFLDVEKVIGSQHLSLSIGVAQYRPGESLADLLARADAGLYRAKQLGRNQVAWIGED